MVAKLERIAIVTKKATEKVEFVQQMLGQLAQVARAEQEDMLGYLIDMAYEEAGDALKRRN
nr:hypothetical protein [uncultured Gellertiella sp.]